MQNKYPLILFSGGNDSTCLLNLALVHSHVYTLYVDASQHEDKIEMELRARAAIFKQLKQDAEHHVLADYGVRELQQLNGFHGWRMELRQVLPWLIAALYTVDPEKMSEVQIGYLLDDDIAYKIEVIQRAWKNLWELVFKEPLVPIRFPFIENRFTKADVLKNLPASLSNKTWVCEMPKRARKLFKPCGFCDPCLTVFTTKLKQKMLDEHNNKQLNKIITRSGNEVRKNLQSSMSSSGKSLTR